MRTVILLNQDQMGHGDTALGQKILGTFLKKSIALPDFGAIVFFNAGVKLVAEGSPVLAELRLAFGLLRDALGQLVSGALAGLFDDHTNIAVDWNAPIQSLSLSRLGPLGDEAIGIALVCLNSWGRGMREIAAQGDLRIVVRDEMWKAMRLGVEAVKSLDEDLRLSRGVAGRGGDIQWANAHKPSDMLTVGDQGSQAANIARDLMHLADIKILHGQKPAVAGELDAMLGLGRQATEVMTDWALQRKGRALWLVGERSYKVETRLHPVEEHLTWTNEALEGAI